MLCGNLIYFLFAFFSYQNIISLMVQYVIISLNLQIFVTWFLQSVLLTSMWWFIHAALIGEGRQLLTIKHLDSCLKLFGESGFQLSLITSYEFGECGHLKLISKGSSRPKQNLKMVVKRSSTKKSLVKYVNSKTNKLSLNVDLINPYYYLRELHHESKPDVLKKMPGFNNVRNGVVEDIIWIWQAAGLPIISFSQIQAKFNGVVAKFEAEKNWAKVYQSVPTSVLRNGWTSFLITKER